MVHTAKLLILACVFGIYSFSSGSSLSWEPPRPQAKLITHELAHTSK